MNPLKNFQSLSLQASLQDVAAVSDPATFIFMSAVGEELRSGSLLRRRHDDCQGKGRHQKGRDKQHDDIGIAAGKSQRNDSRQMLHEAARGC